MSFGETHRLALEITKKDIFPWALLHPELRNKIYKYALVDPNAEDDKAALQASNEELQRERTSLSMGVVVGDDHRRSSLPRHA